MDVNQIIQFNCYFAYMMYVMKLIISRYKRKMQRLAGEIDDDDDENTDDSSDDCYEDALWNMKKNLQIFM